MASRNPFSGRFISVEFFRLEFRNIQILTKYSKTEIISNRFFVRFRCPENSSSKNSSLIEAFKMYLSKIEMIVRSRKNIFHDFFGFFTRNI